MDAPVVEEFPITLECEVAEAGESVSGYRVVGKIVHVLADESVLADDGKPDITKVTPLTFDQFHNDYYTLGERVAGAWDAGKGLM